MSTRVSPVENLKGLRQGEVENIGSLLSYLSHAGGTLTVDGVDYNKLWDGARPLMIYLPDRAVANANALRSAFARHMDVRVCFALKSCYIPPVVRRLKEAGIGIEVMSDIEWRLATRLGFEPGEIVTNSPARTDSHRREIIASGAGLIGIDCAEELDRVEAEARRLEVHPKVVIRVNPLRDANAFFDVGSKLGADLDGASDLISRAHGSRWIDLVGLHAHQLRHCTDAALFQSMVKGLVAVALDTAPRAKPYEIINLGGGLESRFLLERTGHVVEDFAEAAADALAVLPNDPTVVLEPGRFVVGDAAVAFTGVIGAKENSSEKWLVSEISSNILIPLPDLAYHPIPVSLDRAASWDSYHVGDATCAPSHLCRSAPLPETVDRSGLAILNCGAYTSVYAELWAFPLPRIAIFQDGDLTEVFGQAQQEEMYRAFYR